MSYISFKYAIIIFVHGQVDYIIGQDHLFKRSILLIKAWCYYESRILGAHHRLISTYALETLVLYIFQVFHSSLDGPLAVSVPGLIVRSLLYTISGIQLTLSLLSNFRFYTNFWITSANLTG